MKIVFRWKVIASAVGVAFLLLYSPVITSLPAWFESYSINLNGSTVGLVNRWLVDADFRREDGARTLMFSKIDVLTPWKKKRRLLLIEKPRQFEVPEMLAASKTIVATPIGQMQVVAIADLPGAWVAGATSSTRYIGLTEDGIVVHMWDIGDVSDALEFQPRSGAA